MQRTLCQVFPAGGKLPVGGFAARKILPCKLCHNCGRSVCINLILSGCTIFAVWCLQRLPELLPRDENATPPIPENRAHGLAGLSGKRMDRNLSLWCSFQTTLGKKYVKRGKKGKQKRNSLVLWSGSTAALATRNRATVQSPLFGKK